MRVLITGITGMAGSFLAEYLAEHHPEVDVFGTFRWRSKLDNLQQLRTRGLLNVLDEGQRITDQQSLRRFVKRGQVTVIDCELQDASAVRGVIRAVQPERIFHLAAQSFVPTSFEQPVLTGEFTALGVTRLLEAVRLAYPEARFYQASSSEMFGKAQETPQKEGTPFYPRSPYGVAKVYGHWITVNYRESYGLYAVSGILFNHESPRRGLEFVTRKVTHAVARIKRGKATEVRLGNLDARRDWGFAGDYVDAMWRMLQRRDPTDYVIGTGETHTVRELCEIAFGHAGLDWQKHVVVDPKFVRPAEVDLLLADPSRARKELEWTPRTGFAELIKMMVDADLERLA